MSVDPHIEALLNSKTENFEQIIDLCGIDIRNDLAGADLANLNLVGVNFKGANLEEVDLSSANLDSTNLDYCHLSKAILARSNISKAYARKTVFEGAHMQQASFFQVDLFGAVLSNSVIDRAIFHECRFEEARVDVESANGAILADCSGLDSYSSSRLEKAGARIYPMRQAIVEFPRRSKQSLEDNTDEPVVTSTDRAGSEFGQPLSLVEDAGFQALVTSAILTTTAFRLRDDHALVEALRLLDKAVNLHTSEEGRDNDPNSVLTANRKLKHDSKIN